ncbi:MAG: family 78 glycoside hydrolase catalytic domain [Thermogutta sp.]
MRWLLLAIGCWVLALGLSVRFVWSEEQSPARVVQLRCEYRVNPLGIGTTRPRLSWTLNDPRPGAAQTAYQILVASTPEILAQNRGDLWDTGKVASPEMNQIEYAGEPLKSRTTCYWKVRIWDANQQVTPFSEAAMWSMGLLQPEDFKARWIQASEPLVHPQKRSQLGFAGCAWVWYPEENTNPREKAPAGPRYFRKIVELPANEVIKRARFLITADDAFDLFCNGQPAGRGAGYNAPQIADVTNRMNPGKNTLAIVATNASPSPAGVCGRLRVEFESGRVSEWLIDETWRCSAQVMGGWDRPDFDDSSWPFAIVVGKMGDKPWGPISAEGLDIFGCALFRKEFRIDKPVQRATLYMSALGVAEVHLNGRLVNDEYFAPGWTDYRKRVYYNAYDVTNYLSQGDNAIGAILAAGWYSGAIGWKSERFHFGRDPKLWIQLEIVTSDGESVTIVSDETWKYAFGPHVEGEFLAGETYDARLEIPNWAKPGLDDNQWKPAIIARDVQTTLEAQRGVPIIRTSELPTKSISEPKPGVFVFDLGQNFAGFARLKVRGPKGTAVQLRFAEMLNPDGTIYTTNLRSARATDTYVLKGEGEESWEPRFTFHGFRYVEVTGYPGRPSEDSITGIAINSDIPLVGSFRCSSEMINQLYSNIVWTQRANFISVPTDCPQRDERLGWTGDAQVFIRAATYNADVAAFFNKWLVDLEDAQGPEGDFPDVAPRVVALGGGTAAWADAGVICPWTIYWVYRDRRVLEEHFDAMERWIAYCQKHSKDLLRPAAGYGDWLSINADTPKDVLATAFFAYSTHLTAECARILGLREKAAEYDKLFQEIREAFQKAFVAPDGRVKGNTQTCYVLALYFDLLPKDLRPKAVQYLVDDITSRGTHLSTGFVGTAYLMPVLSETENTPLAYRLFLNDTFPSWGFSIKHGATSIWERWDGWTPEKGFQNPGMNSFAHYSFGAVGRWMFQYVAGIDTDGPGFRHLIMKPHVADSLDWVDARYGSICGDISSRWWYGDDGLWHWRITIPANIGATVYVPCTDPEKVQVNTGKDFARLVAKESRAAVFQVPAGTYEFSAFIPGSKDQAK